MAGVHPEKARSTGVAQQIVMLHGTETFRTHTDGDTGPLNTAVRNDPPVPGPDVGPFDTNSFILIPACKRKATIILFSEEKEILKCHTARTRQSPQNCILITLLPASYPLGSEEPESGTRFFFMADPSPSLCVPSQAQCDCTLLSFPLLTGLSRFCGVGR